MWQRLETRSLSQKSDSVLKLVQVLFIALALCPANRDGTFANIDIRVGGAQALCSGMELTGDLGKIVGCPHNGAVGNHRAFRYGAADNKQRRCEVHHLLNYGLLNYGLLPVVENKQVQRAFRQSTCTCAVWS